MPKTKAVRFQVVSWFFVWTAFSMILSACFLPAWVWWLYALVPISLATAGGVVLGVVAYDWVMRGDVAAIERARDEQRRTRFR